MWIEILERYFDKVNDRRDKRVKNQSLREFADKPRQDRSLNAALPFPFSARGAAKIAGGRARYDNEKRYANKYRQHVCDGSAQRRVEERRRRLGRAGIFRRGRVQERKEERGRDNRGKRDSRVGTVGRAGLFCVGRIRIRVRFAEPYARRAFKRPLQNDPKDELLRRGRDDDYRRDKDQYDRDKVGRSLCANEHARDGMLSREVAVVLWRRRFRRLRFWGPLFWRNVASLFIFNGLRRLLRRYKPIFDRNLSEKLYKRRRDNEINDKKRERDVESPRNGANVRIPFPFAKNAETESPRRKTDKEIRANKTERKLKPKRRHIIGQTVFACSEKRKSAV